LSVKRIGRKILKVTGIILGILAVLAVSFHFWFKAHAKGIIEDMVSSQSNGKLKLKIGKLHFNYFSKKIELEKSVFYSTDTLTGSTAYRFTADKIKIQATAILPIVFKKRLLIDSLTLLSPHIMVTRLRAIDKSGNKDLKDVSIPEEMGKVYKSIQDALQVLEVKRFQIDNGTFTLANKITPNQLPITISNLHFHIDNLKVNGDTLTGNEKLLFSENIVLKSHDQNILFPDGRHRLSFSKFNINLQRKLVEFDSCTIAATRGDSTDASFNVFFDALMLTNIDFDLLYKTQVIKADSVYCVNPKFNLDVQIGKKKGTDKPAPKLGDIVKQLTGDLKLAHVIVTNADFNIKTIKDGNPSSFTFSNNNFEMQGLTIDQDAAKPLKVESFAMAIRNYENFIKDSSYSIKFDSILFKGDQITLSNFLFNKLDNGRIVNTFSIPQFNLQGMSWDDLVFEKKLKAERAVLFNPHIIYTATNKTQNKNIFQSLGSINEYMDLQSLEIWDGTIDLKLKNNLQVQLENANVSVESNSLLTSTKLSGIKNSLTSLTFNNGRIQAGKMIIELNDIRYVGKSGQFGAGSIDVLNKEKNIDIHLQEVTVDKMQVDEITGSVVANGINWQKGDVNINALPAQQKKGDDEATIDLTNVRGGPTSVHSVVNGKTISTELDKIYFTTLFKKPGSKLQLDGLDITGKKLDVKDANMYLSIANYDILDNNNSTFRQLRYTSNNGKTKADITIPSLTTIPHIQPLLNGEIALDAINIEKPVIDIQLTGNSSAQKNKAGLPKIDISAIKLLQPTISFTQASDSGTIAVSWHGENNTANYLQGNNLHASEGKTVINNLNFFLTDFVFTNANGKTFATKKGQVSADLRDLKLTREEDLPLEWTAKVANLDTKDIQLDSVGKSKSSLVLKTGTLSNLNISSSNILKLQRLAEANAAFQIKRLTGTWANASNILQWHNASFTRNNNIFSLDSFSMMPALTRDSFLAKQSFQTDYITLQSGAINIGPFDINTFIENNTLNIGTATVDNFRFTDYRDKKLPFNAGIIKPLTVNLLKTVPQKIAVKNLQLNNATVEYTETNQKTNAEGTIPVTRMNIRISNAKNYNFSPTDSLTLRATGYLMDTAWMHLQVKESYTDSLGGFLMTLRIKPTDLTILNPVLMPLGSAKIVSGYLDTLSMRAIGREYLALGKMEMRYHDLKIRIFKNGDSTRKNPLTGLANLIIKNKNTSRTGNVFFIRKRDRSAINYLIKIAMSGMMSSVGVKSNKKMIRKYKKELEKRNLPPIDLE